MNTDAIFEAYKTWPEDIRKKLSAHDLRRMAGWNHEHPNPTPGDRRIEDEDGGSNGT